MGSWSYIDRKVPDAAVPDDNNFGVPGKFTQNLCKALAKGDVDVQRIDRIGGGRIRGRYFNDLTGLERDRRSPTGQPGTGRRRCGNRLRIGSYAHRHRALILGRLAIGRSRQKEDQR